MYIFGNTPYQNNGKITKMMNLSQDELSAIYLSLKIAFTASQAIQRIWRGGLARMRFAHKQESQEVISERQYPFLIEPQYAHFMEVDL